MFCVLQGNGVSTEGYDRGRAKPLEGRMHLNVGHVKSWKGGYMWRSFRRQLWIMIVCFALKTVYSTDVVVD
jgi:hypothetical protein